MDTALAWPDSPNHPPRARRRLSRREREVMELLEKGRSQKEVAHELGLGHSTVRVLLTRARRKLRDCA